MQPSAEYFVPVADVHCVRADSGMALAAASSGQRYPLSEAGVRVWTMLQERGRTVDRLVIALARRSSGQELEFIPDHVVAELDRFIVQGVVRRIVI